jgi:hypothetical protein
MSLTSALHSQCVPASSASRCVARTLLAPPCFCKARRHNRGVHLCALAELMLCGAAHVGVQMVAVDPGLVGVASTALTTLQQRDLLAHTRRRKVYMPDSAAAQKARKRRLQLIPHAQQLKEDVLSVFHGRTVSGAALIWHMIAQAAVVPALVRYRTTMSARRQAAHEFSAEQSRLDTAGTLFRGRPCQRCPS